VAAEVEIGLALFAEGEEAHVEFGLEAQGVDQEIEIGWGEFGAEFVVVGGVGALFFVYFTHEIQFTNRLSAISFQLSAISFALRAFGLPLRGFRGGEERKLRVLHLDHRFRNG